jgi:hypothetical protein
MPIGDVDVGYGPARSFTPEEVEQIATFLGGLNEAQLRGRLDFKQMADAKIYPSLGKEEAFIDEEWEYLGDVFRRLKRFVQETASRKMALLVYIN